MARSPICDHKMTRVSADGYKATWDYAWDITEGGKTPNHNFDWQYHANACNVHEPSNMKVMESAPDQQQHSPAPATKAIGSDEEPNYVTNAGKYWPSAPWRLTGVCLDCYLDGNGSTQSTQWLNFKEPKVPVVTMTRNYSTLTYEIDSRGSEMEKSEFYRTSTRYLLQVIDSGTEGWASLPTPARYDENAGNWQHFAGDKSTDVDGGAVIEYVADGMPPEFPVMVRLCAANDGPSGESEIVYSDVHVFGRPKTPTLTMEDCGDHVTATVRYNDDEWHPVDHSILQRQVSPTQQKNGSWTDVTDADYNSSSVITMDDGQSDRLPPEDNATWYRVACWHDEPSNVSYGYDEVPTLMSKPKKPTVSGEYNSATNTITATVSVESEMEVRTLCQVVSGSVEKSNWMEVHDGTAVLDVKDLDPRVVYRLRCKNVYCGALPRKLGGHTLESDVAESADIASSEQAAAIGATLSAVVIDSVTQNPDGTGLTLNFHWGAESLGTAQVTEVGTLVEWTSAPGGWVSTTAPEQYKMPDSNGATGVISVDSLEEGTPYRIRLRRYATIDGVDGYGPEATTQATPESTPGTPVLSAPMAVAVGEPVRYYWSFSDANSTPQVEAHLYVNGNLQEPVLGPSGTYVFQTNSNTPSTLEARVQVTTGGGWSELSEPVATLVTERPTGTAGIAGSSETGTVDYGGNTLTALPLRLALGGTADTFGVRVVAASTANSPEPDGGREVASGDTVAVATVHGTGTHSIASDRIIAGGCYTVEVIPHDSFTGLDGDPVSLGFGVTWATPAVIPTGTVAFQDGEALVTPARGTGAAATETCRIWRSTADGPMLCCEDAAWGGTYADKWPAYGWDGCAYIVESVSADGDHRWAEIPYELAGGSLKVDFGETLELPFNLERKSSWKNTFERRAHMDGSRTGYWEPGHDRDYSASGDVPKDDLATANLVRSLGRHSGICLVRANHGVCFAAHVDASLDESYMGARFSVDLSAEQVDDDGTFFLERRA